MYFNKQLLTLIYFSIEKIKLNPSSDSDDNLPLSKFSKHKKQKRKHKTELSPKREKTPEPVPLDYSVMLERMRFKRSIEECDERGCSYSDHYPQTHTPVAPIQACECAGPSGNKSPDVKIEKWYSSADSSD